jgi:hypothetical protein
MSEASTYFDAGEHGPVTSATLLKAKELTSDDRQIGSADR